MASKVILAVALVSVLLPYFALGQTTASSATCTTAAGCASQCCVINAQTSWIFGVATGNCAAAQPTEGQACNLNCACATGSICTNNILCPKCGKICMATDVYNRLVSYYNTGCQAATCMSSYGYHGGRRSLVVPQFSGVHDLPTM